MFVLILVSFPPDACVLKRNSGGKNQDAEKERTEGEGVGGRKEEKEEEKRKSKRQRAKRREEWGGEKGREEGG